MHAAASPFLLFLTSIMIQPLLTRSFSMLSSHHHATSTSWRSLISASLSRHARSSLANYSPNIQQGRVETAWTSHHHLLSVRQTQPRIFSFAQFSTFDDDMDDSVISNAGFEKGDKVQVEIVSFGPMGASVDIVAKTHNPDDVIAIDEPPLGAGLILQKEIQYFREGRGNVDVVLGEILPAFVERIREDEVTGVIKLDICLREFGGRAKADSVANMIMEKLEWTDGGSLRIGDKSPPELIAQEFPGVSKASFKKAVSALYKQGKVKPGPNSVTLMRFAADDNN